MDAASLSHIPEPVRAIGRRLAERGHDAVLVGGAVRDALLGAPSADWDLVTDASTAGVREAVAGVPQVRSLYDLGERFGTLGIVLEDGARLEVSRYRPDALGAPALADRFALDAGLRDFTVNAIGLDLATGELLDPAGGREDLAAGVIRAPGDPAERLAEDPLRTIRAARFAAELGFEIEPHTRAALPAATPALARVAPERVRDELTRLLVASDAPRGLHVLHASGALAVVLPEVAALDGVTQPTFHDLDVLAHTIQSVGLAPATPVLRWATLLHDIGKAPTRRVEPDGRIRFFRHAQEGERMAAAILSRLRFPTAQARAIVHLVATHMRLGEVDLANPKAVDRAVRALDLRIDETAERPLVSAEDAVELTLADFGATAHRKETPRLRVLLESAVAASRERGTQRAVVSPISGAEIMRAFGLAAGPAVGVAKDAVIEAIERGDLEPADVAGAYVVAEAALGALADPRGPSAPLMPDDDEDLESDDRLKRLFVAVVSLVLVVALLLLIVLGVRVVVPEQRQTPEPPIRMAEMRPPEVHRG